MGVSVDRVEQIRDLWSPELYQSLSQRYCG
jgi:hypothetical protein